MRAKGLIYIKRCMVLFSVAAIVMTLTPALANAEYPEKPVTYIISFNPGGESDVTARLQESQLEKFLGQSVNVTHKPGGGAQWPGVISSVRPSRTVTR